MKKKETLLDDSGQVKDLFYVYSTREAAEFETPKNDKKNYLSRIACFDPCAYAKLESSVFQFPPEKEETKGI